VVWHNKKKILFIFILPIKNIFFQLTFVSLIIMHINNALLCSHITLFIHSMNLKIEYLAKGGFGVVHKATWIKYDYYRGEYREREVVLKRKYNNSSDDKIVDILKEVKQKFIINIKY